MRIAVTTPTGNVGSRLVPRLVQAGSRPLVLVRDAAKLPPEIRAAVDVAEVDLTDADGVIAATRGVDALHWVAPSLETDEPIASYDRLGEIAAAAVAANGIGRVVFQSSGGAEVRHGFGEIDGLGRIEERLDATGADVLHLRCGYFMTNLLLDPDGLRSRSITTQLPVDQRIPWVAPQDIADVTALRLLSSDWVGRVTQGVLGPEDLSFADVAAILTDLVGEPFEAVEISDEQATEMLQVFGMSERQIDAIVGMSRGLRSGYVPEDPRDLRSTTPTTFRAWAAEHVVPLFRSSES